MEDITTEVTIEEFKKLLVIVGKAASILVKDIRIDKILIHILYKKEYEGMIKQHLQEIQNVQVSS